MAHKDGPTVLVGFLGSAVISDDGSAFCACDFDYRSEGYDIRCNRLRDGTYLIDLEQERVTSWGHHINTH